MATGFAPTDFDGLQKRRLQLADTGMAGPERAMQETCRSEGILSLAGFDPTQALARRSDIPNSSRFLCIGQRAFYVAEIVSAARALQRYL